MPNSKEPWYQSPGLIGLLLTLAGFGFFVLLGLYVSQWLLSK